MSNHDVPRKKARLFLDTGCLIGEGPVWDERRGRLYFVDLLGNILYWCENEQTETFSLGQNAGCVCLREQGGLIAALQHGFYFLDPKSRRMEPIFDPESDKPTNRFNDGKIDPQGRFWAGTMSKGLDTGYGDTSPQGTLYCMDIGFHCQAKLGPVTISNGLDWSPDGKTMYFIDTPKRVIQAFAFTPENGTISRGHIAVQIPEGMGNPDGMCTDCEGNLFVALWGGGCVSKWNPNTGALLELIDVPAVNVSSCCFGGAAMDELFITTASIGTDKNAFPYAGGVFHIKPGSRGKHCYRFMG